MKWIVDATPLCYPLTGIGHYVRGMLQALSSIRPGWEFHLVAPYAPLIDDTAPNIFWDPRTSRARKRRRAGWRAFWYDIELPRAVRNLGGADAFWAADGLVPWALGDIRVALSVYDFVPERFPRTMNWFPRTYRRMNARHWIPRAKWRLPISKATADEMIQIYGAPADAVIHPGIDKIFFDAITTAATTECSVDYVLAVGTLEPRKNLAAMVFAIESLVDSGHWPVGLELHLVGGRGWQDGDLLRSVRRLEAAGIARRLGYVARENLPSIMRNARALLMPSLYEGFGMPVAEALAAGCPVICSDIPSFREIYTGPSVVFHGPEPEKIANIYRQHLSDWSGLPRPSGQDAVGAFTWTESARRFVAATAEGAQA